MFAIIKLYLQSFYIKWKSSFLHFRGIIFIILYSNISLIALRILLEIILIINLTMIQIANFVKNYYNNKNYLPANKLTAIFNVLK
jgi:hypothetical protein